MKKFTFLMAMVLGFAMNALALNPYAYAVSGSVADGNLTVNYTINDATATGAEVVFYVQGIALERVALTDFSKGAHTATVAVPAVYGDVTWAVNVKGTSPEAPVKETVTYQFWSPYGIAIDKDPASANFGRLLITEAQGNVPDNYSTGGEKSGLYVFNPDFTPVMNGENWACYKGGLNLTTKMGSGGANAFSPIRVVISEDGRIFASMQDSAKTAAVYELSQDLQTWTPVISGINNGDGTLVDAEGNFVAGLNCSMDVQGSGENLKLLLYSCNMAGVAYAQSGYRLDEYALGTATTFTGTPTHIAHLDGNYGLVSAHCAVYYDEDGGYWFTANRGGNAGEPNLAHFKADGTRDYYSESANYYGGAGMAMHNGKMYMGGNSGYIQVYTVTEGESGLTVTADLDEAAHITTGIGRNVNAIEFDYADNMYACSNSGEKLAAFAMPYSGEVATPFATGFNAECPTYYLIGEGATFGSWTLASAVAMEHGEITVEVPAGNYEFKVLPTNTGWDGQLNVSKVNHELSSANVRGTDNIHVSLAEAGTITLKVLSANCLVVTGDFAEKDFVSEYTLVGDEALTGHNWDLNAADRTMTKVNDSIVTISYKAEIAAAGTYKWKVVGNHAWSVQYPASGDFTVTFDAAGTYFVEFVLNTESGEGECGFEKLLAATQVRAVYSHLYDADCGFGEWGSGTVYAQDEFAKHYTTAAGGYFGLDGFSLNCSQMDSLHIEIMPVSDITSLRIVPIHGGAEQGVMVENLVADEWNVINIALTAGDWANVTDWTNVYQIKIDNAANAEFLLREIYFFTTREIGPDAEPEMPDGPNIYDYTTTTVESWFANTSWTQETESSAVMGEDGKITVTIAQDKGAQWQGQVKLHTDLNYLVPETDFALSVKMKSNVAFGGITIKAFDDEPIYNKSSYEVKADEEVEFIMVGKKALVNNGVLVFDFGFAPAGAVIEIYDIYAVGTKEVPAGVESLNAAKVAYKTIENGQVVIVRNGVRYNMQGVTVK